MPTVETLKEITPFLSILVALAALAISPLITFSISKRQLVAPIRQKWIDELRNYISDFLSSSLHLIAITEAKGIFSNGEIDEDTYKKLLLIERKITLMLNPNEHLHNELLKQLRKALDEVEHGANDVLEFGSRIAAITEVAQKILKIEWVRVKHGKL